MKRMRISMDRGSWGEREIRVSRSGGEGMMRCGGMMRILGLEG